MTLSGTLERRIVMLDARVEQLEAALELSRECVSQLRRDNLRLHVRTKTLEDRIERKNIRIEIMRREANRGKK